LISLGILNSVFWVEHILQRGERSMAHRIDQASSSTIDELLDQATRLLVEAAHPQKIILFGSYARGDFDEDSDLDFLVILPEVKNRFSEMARLQDVLTPLRVPTDVMVYSIGEVAERGHLPGSALRWALEEGTVLYATA
jgi:predicted nucleotidyltransferase